MDEFVSETEEYIDICLGLSEWQDSEGNDVIEKDYRVKGEVWRVHKSDADPFPSNPHAHCIDGTERFIGCTLHLGTRELYRKRKTTGKLLAQKQFDQLIKLIQPKFPDTRLPLEG